MKPMSLILWFILSCGFILSGCSPATNTNPSSAKKWNHQKSWHANVGWKAEDFFNDPSVIALCIAILCIAIETKNMETFDKLLAEGVNVNVRGKGNMTPLFWAYPENRGEYFKKLLEHGADPNVLIEDHFGLPQWFNKETSLTYIVAGSSKIIAGSDRTEYFKWIMEHGGDPNQIQPGFDNQTPITAAINANRIDDVKMLIQKNADLNYVAHSLDSSPVMKCVSCNNYEMVLLLLEAGASYKLDRRGNGKDWNLIRILAERYDQWIDNKSKKGDDFRKVIDWIKKDGFDVEKAKDFLDNWGKATLRMSDEEFFKWQRDNFGTK